MPHRTMAADTLPDATSALIARMLAQREQWVDLQPGLRVRVRRPAETAIPRLRHGITTDDAAAACVDWQGFSEATLLGAAVGSADPLRFDAALWLEVLRDRADWCGTVMDAMVDMVRAHVDARGIGRKNYSPSSTQAPESSSRANDQPSQTPDR